MRKLLVLFCPSLLFSCVQDDLTVAPDAPADNVAMAEQDDNAVTISDLDNLVKDLHPSESRAGGYTISTITDEKGQPCIYAINYSQGGWVLVSATKKYQPVIARNDEGYFNVSDSMPGGLEMWKDNMVSLISDVDSYVPQDTIELYKKEWAHISPQPAAVESSMSRSAQIDHYTDAPVFSSDFTQADYNRLRSIMADTIAEMRRKGYTVETFDNLRYGDLIPGEYGTQGITINDLIAMCDGMTYIYYSENFRFLSFAVYREERTEEKTGPIIKSIWAQDGGYNQTFPLRENGKRDLAGCVPVAAGQLMRHFRHPTNYKNFNWDEMPLNYPTPETSDFLYDIGKKMNTTLSTEGSTTTTGDMVNFLNNYYTFTIERASNLRMVQVMQGQLMMIRADFGSESGHMWLSGGLYANWRTTRFDIYTFTLPEEMTPCGNMQQETIYPTNKTFYMNWGWGGRYDGYFASYGWRIPGCPNTASDITILYNFSKK